MLLLCDADDGESKFGLWKVDEVYIPQILSLPSTSLVFGS